MRKALLLLSLCFICLKPSAQSITDSVLQYADEKVEAYASSFPGISVSVSFQGDIVWNKVMGFKDLESKTPVDRDTRFNIYSTSKLITGLAFLKLAQQRGLELMDQNIRSIDPELPKAFDGITLRQLLTHTSGIRHYNGRKDWTRFSELRCDRPADGVAYFAGDPLKAKPGKKEIYTTYGMVLASHLLEKLTEMDFLSAINNLVPFSDPIELDSEKGTKATPYIPDGSAFKAIPNLSAECKFAGGGLIASSDQLVEAGQIMYEGDFIPLDELKVLLESQYADGKTTGTSFGFGNGRTDLFGEEILYAAMGGGSPGGRSYILVLADLQVAVAITGNVEADGEEAYRLSLDLAKKFAGVEE